MIRNHPFLLLILVVILLLFLWARRRQRLGRPFQLRRRLPRLTVDVRGRPRTAHVQGPPGNRRGAPLLIALHGGLGRVERFMQGTGLPKRARDHGYAIAFPVAPDGWVDGRPEKGTGTEDLDFIAALIEAMVTKHGIDRRQVYALGVSNGGMFVQRLATERPDLLAGAASIVASTPAAIAREVASGPPMPFALICDRNDDIMPYEGGEIRRGATIGHGGEVIPVEDARAVWVERNGAGGPAQTRTITGPEGFRAELTDHVPMGHGVPVRFVAVSGSGHGWPRWPGYRGATAFDAGEIVLEFFDAVRRHITPRG